VLVEKIIVIGRNGAANNRVHVQDPSTGVWSQLWEAPNGSTAKAIVGCNGGQIIAVSSGIPYHYDGETWTAKSAITGTTNGVLLSAAGNNYNAVWAAIAETTWKSVRWNGSTWESSKTCCNNVGQIWGVSATEAWAVGGTNLMHTTDGGDTWTNLRSQADSDVGGLWSAEIQGIWGWAANNVYFLARGWMVRANHACKLFRWDGSVFHTIPMTIELITGPPPPAPGSQIMYWYHNIFGEMMGWCDRIWGTAPSQLVHVGIHTEGGMVGTWTTNDSVASERERGTWPGAGGKPRLRGLSDNSRIVQIPEQGTMGRESLNVGITWGLTDASFPATTAKDISVFSYTTVAPTVDEEDPIDGETAVSVDHNIHLHVHKGSSALDESTILIQLNGVDVWKNNVAQPGFSVVKSSIADGFSFDIDPDSNLSPATEYTVYVFAENDTDHVDEYWSFSTSANIVVDIFIVAKDVIMVMFSEGVVANNEYKDVNNYEITSVSGGTVPVVSQVLPAYERVPQIVLLKVDYLELGNEYSLLIKQIYNSDGKVSSNVTATWIQHKTKVDIAISTLSDMWNTSNRSIIRSIIEAVMISDEKIGGNY